MSQMADVYACKNCDHTQYSVERADHCEKCGGVLTRIHGVQVTIDEEDTKKYAHELSRKSRNHSDPKPFLSSRGYGD